MCTYNSYLMLSNNLFQGGAHLYNQLNEKYDVTFSDFNKTGFLAYNPTRSVVLYRMFVSLIKRLCWSMNLDISYVYSQ